MDLLKKTFKEFKKTFGEDSEVGFERVVSKTEPEWISVDERLPATSEDENQQVEVVFYKSKYEWWAGMFTAKGKLSNKDKFEYHQHWGDDQYHEIEGVTHWMRLL